jgi:hypothetical protein
MGEEIAGKTSATATMSVLAQFFIYSPDWVGAKVLAAKIYEPASCAGCLSVMG